MTWDHVRAIAEEKMEDLNAFEVESAMKMIAGTARSMGIIVEGVPPWGGEAQEVVELVDMEKKKAEAAEAAAAEAEAAGTEAVPEEGSTDQEQKSGDKGGESDSQEKNTTNE